MEPPDTSTDAALAAIGAAVFHGHVESRNDKGRYSGVGHAGEPIKEALTAYPYGFRSYAPANTGLVFTRSAAGLLVLSQENALPDGVSEPLNGETLLYNAHGAQVHLDENGDIIHEPKAGRYIKLGDGAAKKVALDGDRCPGTELMNTWMAAVEAGIPTGTPPAVLASTFNESEIANAMASATKVKAE